MERPSWAPQEIDLERPSAARVYDYILGGSHNFAVDRELARSMLQMFPEAPQEAQANREFLRRAVKYCADAGVRQFIDIGSGIPTEGNVHEVAQQLAPDTRVLYADLDPVAVAHSRAILAGNDAAAAIQADVREPQSILDHPAARELIDFTAPVALLLVAVLHFVPDEQDPAGIVRRYAAALAPGSHLVLSHIGNDINPEMARKVTELTARVTTPGTFRSRKQVTALFDGWSLVEPGLVPVPLWRPDSPDDVDPDAGSSHVYAGVGRRDGDQAL